MALQQSKSLSSTTAIVVTLVAVLALASCNRSRGADGLDRSQQPTTSSLETPSQPQSRWGRFRERIRNLGNRNRTQEIPAPVNTLPTLNSTATASTPIAPTVPAPTRLGERVTEANMNWTPEASRDYNGQYQRDANNKSFAVSPDGPYGVAFGYTNADEASAAALAECRRDVQPGQLDCITFDVNGQITLLFPAQVTRR